jgi:hypothetical protein
VSDVKSDEGQTLTTINFDTSIKYTDMTKSLKILRKIVNGLYFTRTT